MPNVINVAIIICLIDDVIKLNLFPKPSLFNDTCI